MEKMCGAGFQEQFRILIHASPWAACIGSVSFFALVYLVNKSTNALGIRSLIQLFTDAFPFAQLFAGRAAEQRNIFPLCLWGVYHSHSSAVWSCAGNSMSETTLLGFKNMRTASYTPDSNRYLLPCELLSHTDKHTGHF